MNKINPLTRLQKFGYVTTDDHQETNQRVLVEYVSAGGIAIITLNRQHADNTITTELAALLIGALQPFLFYLLSVGTYLRSTQ